MSLLLLAVGLTLLGGLQALHKGPGDPNFDEKLVKGKWFSVAMASNEPKFITKDTDMKFFIHNIQVTPKSLQLHVHRKVKGVCVPTTMTANKTGKKFQYTVNHSSHKMIFLEKVDPQHFAIFCTHSVKHGKETMVVNLFSRTPTVSPDVLWMFRKYCKTHGIHSTNIVDLTQTGRCPPHRQPQEAEGLGPDACSAHLAPLCSSLHRSLSPRPPVDSTHYVLLPGNRPFWWGERVTLRTQGEVTLKPLQPTPKTKPVITDVKASDSLLNAVKANNSGPAVQTGPGRVVGRQLFPEPPWLLPAPAAATATAEGPETAEAHSPSLPQGGNPALSGCCRDRDKPVSTASGLQVGPTGPPGPGQWNPTAPSHRLSPPLPGPAFNQPLLSPQA
ncbi:PREDICTED: epididymal-specific lipocalin-9 [Ceratotherium simum simum]|uniref:Epididymal-specific lipocalin-9 n=1 Tax=Ceratotherium simum simum TaxID=73337 RepID=A0ABM1CD34_CERSS|nr:PREDICTED: epididymal-specific lipocalin-9 [Ceratotherium simum simum]